MQMTNNPGIRSEFAGRATEIRTPVPALKGLCPSPLDDGSPDTSLPQLGIETPVRIRNNRDANDSFVPLDTNGGALVYAPTEVQAPAGQEPVLLANGSCPPYDTGSARALAFAMLLALGYGAGVVAAVAFGVLR
jgi:hypothetical protein